MKLENMYPQGYVHLGYSSTVVTFVRPHGDALIEVKIVLDFDDGDFFDYEFEPQLDISNVPWTIEFVQDGTLGYVLLHPPTGEVWKVVQREVHSGKEPEND